MSENITITNCLVSGYEIGSLLDGTYKRTVKQAPDRDGPTGRIKIGTESEGDFRNIAISNCVFDTSRGLALESVDGAHIEDVSVSNITMRDVSNAPIFLRLGSRMRAPEGTAIGSIRRISISNVTAYNADPRYGSIISGIPGHDVEDVNAERHPPGLPRRPDAGRPPRSSPPTWSTPSSSARTGGVPPREAVRHARARKRISRAVHVRRPARIRLLHPPRERRRVERRRACPTFRKTAGRRSS